jgi:hypothetical protein
VLIARVTALGRPGADIPQFWYHVGDLFYFAGLHDDYYSHFYEP